jgi:hypothetical protein
LSFLDLLNYGKRKRTGKKACPTKNKTPRLEPGRSGQQRDCTTRVMRVKLEIRAKEKSKPAALKTEGGGTHERLRHAPVEN